jgi:AcrR family transcriptional regulator
VPRPYAAQLAKGEDRRQRIVSVAQRLVVQNGWRNTSLAQIAKNAGVSTAGLLHHFESKEQLLNAVADARDADDLAHASRSGDLLAQLSGVLHRFDESPDVVGLFTVLLIENLEPDAPLHDRLLQRSRVAVDTVETGIRRGQRAGKYRRDVDPATKAVEVIAFLNGMETLWLLDRSIPIHQVFTEYMRSLSQQLTLAGTG